VPAFRRATEKRLTRYFPLGGMRRSPKATPCNHFLAHERASVQGDHGDEVERIEMPHLALEVAVLGCLPGQGVLVPIPREVAARIRVGEAEASPTSTKGRPGRE